MATFVGNNRSKICETTIERQPTENKDILIYGDLFIAAHCKKKVNLGYIIVRSEA